jgi:serine-type D-Ala-D-Ala endopeptidase (penicillin-binding protein 7)
MQRRGWLVIILLGVFLLSASSDAAKKGAKKPAKKKAPPPIPALTSDGKPNVLSESVIVIDLKTGEELFTKNAGEKRPIASVSKLAAALAVQKKKLDLKGVTEITQEDADIALRGSKPHIRVGWKITNQDLLYSALIASENRAVPAMGRGAGLTPEQLVKEMNGVAKDLGLKNTSFDEPTGLSYGNQSSARDVAKMLKAAITDPVLADAMTQEQWEIKVVEPSGYSVSIMNTDRLMRSEKYTVLGGKTGYNDQAGYCLAVALKVGTRDVAIVTLGATGKLTRYGDVSRVVSWLSAKDAAVATKDEAKK